MDGYRHEELSDELLEREIEAVLDVDPSPEFLPGLRARIAAERVHHGLLWFLPWRWAGAVAVVGALAAIAVWSLRDSVPAPREVHISTPTVGPSRAAPDEPSLENKIRPTPAASADSPTPEDRHHRSVARTMRSTRRQVEMARQEVVVSGDEVVALRHLVGAIVARQVKAVDIPALGVESAPLPAIEEIVLEPITLSPMDETLE